MKFHNYETSNNITNLEYQYSTDGHGAALKSNAIIKLKCYLVKTIRQVDQKN